MIIVVADFFAADLVGGAELTTEAILEATDKPIVKILSRDLTLDVIKKYENEKWIFGNLTKVKTQILDYILSTSLDYHMIEYDYKCCIMRLPEYHKKVSGKCCSEEIIGKTISAFFSNAKTLWFMSQGQKNWYDNEFPVLKDHKNSYVLSSIFDKQTISTLAELDCTNKNDVYLIQKHGSRFKGTKESVKYAQDNNLNYELFGNIAYKQVLEKFAQSRGFIFLPTEFDTCPRVTIEAKLLGCEVITNDNVQHRNEIWFNSNSSVVVSHMQERLEFFWNTI